VFSASESLPRRAEAGAEALARVWARRSGARRTISEQLGQLLALVHQLRILLAQVADLRGRCTGMTLPKSARWCGDERHKKKKGGGGWRRGSTPSSIDAGSEFASIEDARCGRTCSEPRCCGAKFRRGCGSWFEWSSRQSYRATTGHS
jgi:hypothetical protein